MLMLKRYFRFVVYLIVLAAVFPAIAQDEVAFFRAVNIDDDRGVRRWLEAGGDPNKTNAQGQPALTLALRDESFKAAAALLDHPSIRVDAPNALGETALMMAALKGHSEWARRLVAKGAAINREGWTPLHYAASGGGFEVLRWLVEQGAAIDARSPNRSTPLMMAARYGASESVDWLLARGADPSLRNDRELSAADFARSAGRDAMAERLASARLNQPVQR